MEYLKPLITLDYWFNLNPGPFAPPVFIGLGILLIVVFLAGAVVKILSYRSRRNPPLHRVLSRIGRAILWLAVVGLGLYFFSYEQIYALSARFWWALSFLGAIVWAVFIVLDILKRYPGEKLAFAEKLKREKYLPK